MTIIQKVMNTFQNIYPTVISERMRICKEGIIHLEVICPDCRDTHFHGAGFRIQNVMKFPTSFGHRAPHCLTNGSNGYEIEWNLLRTKLDIFPEHVPKFVETLPRRFHKNIRSILSVLIDLKNSPDK